MRASLLPSLLPYLYVCRATGKTIDSNISCFTDIIFRAGLPVVYSATCGNEQPNTPAPSGVPRDGPTCYLDNVPGPGSPRYDEAYFEISHIRAYTTAAPSPSPSPNPEPLSPTKDNGNTTINFNGTTVTFQPNTDIPNANINSNGVPDICGRHAMLLLFTWFMGLAGFAIGYGLPV